MFQAVRSVTGGLVASVLSLAYCFSYGALIFAGPLQQFLPYGIAAALITTVVTATIVALTSSFRSAVAGPDSNTAALLAAMMVTLSPAIATMRFQDALIIALCGLGAATFLTGIALFLLGWRKLGKLVRFIPYPVVAGFLAATGWLMLSGSITMVTGAAMSWATWQSFAAANNFFIIGITAIWAAILWFLTARWKHPLVLPLALIAAVIVTHVVVTILPSAEALTVRSLLFFPVPEQARPVIPLLLGRELINVDWTVLLPITGDMVAVAVLAILSILLNSTSIEVATEAHLDLDRELRAQGFANVLSAIAGGFVGHVSVSRTLVNIAAGGVTRISGLTVGLVALAVLIIGSEAISFVPRVVLGGLVLQLGIRLIWDWGLLSFRTLPLIDWLVVVAIVLITSQFGFLHALLFGMLAGCVIFVVDVSRVRIIRHQYGLDERCSSRVRSQQESALLLQHGGQVQILELSGNLFFGSAYSLLERVAHLVTDKNPKEIIFDFSRVTGVDSSAGTAFIKIRDLLRKSETRQAVVGLPQIARRVLNSHAGLDDGVRRYDSLDTALEQAEESILATQKLSANLYSSMVEWLTDVLGSHAHAQILFDRMTPAPRDAQSYLCRQGADTDSLIFIERGPVSVTLEREDQPALRVRVFGSYTLVGEVGFFLNAPRSANLLSAPDAVVWSLNRDAFYEFMRAYPKEALALTIYVIRLQSERLTFANRLVASLQR
jgi:SulP family sulfate permease